ncbi:MAG TPA: hypothetical protein VJ673_08420 [Aromatoleum sp.]|nr:hypothetical protein [Aromatoleum sp.]HJV25698.1 hypothetical protein [Aromatoleum sp.]
MEIHQFGRISNDGGEVPPATPGLCLVVSRVGRRLVLRPSLSE